MKHLDSNIISPQERSVADIVTENYKNAEVFRKYGIDFCCGGKTSLRSACELMGLSTDKIINELKKATTATDSSINFDKLSISKLIDHIVSTHHVYARKNLPTIKDFLEKIVIVHGKNHPELIEAQKVFQKFSDELYPHMRTEEQDFFPLAKQLDPKNKPRAREYFGKKEVLKYIAQMGYEHITAGNYLKDLRRTSNDYFIPNDACQTYKTTYKMLRKAEDDLHQHIHLENNLLFPMLLSSG